MAVRGVASERFADPPVALADLVDGNLGESGVMALGATNALYFDAP